MMMVMMKPARAIFADPLPICRVSIAPSCRTRILDALDGHSLADCSQVVLVKAMGLKDVQSVYSLPAQLARTPST